MDTLTEFLALTQLTEVTVRLAAFLMILASYKVAQSTFVSAVQEFRWLICDARKLYFLGKTFDGPRGRRRGYMEQSPWR
ncbi:hypothetical protein KM043_016721 [Ampulex compressa]|nr:hypothetical protein KM043_016721 [Ampulex compressa]